jgi:hypothetical protein
MSMISKIRQRLNVMGPFRRTFEREKERVEIRRVVAVLLAAGATEGMTDHDFEVDLVWQMPCAVGGKENRRDRRL